RVARLPAGLAAGRLLEDRGLGLWGVGRRRQRRVGGVGPEPLLQVFELPLQFIDALPQRLNDGVAPGTSRAFHFAHAFILRSPALNREKRWAVTILVQCQPGAPLSLIL